MRVDDIETTPSPDRPTHARLRATVTYDDGHAPESYWFDVPGNLADESARTGDPWLTALLPLAATLGEPLRIPLPVDATLLDGAEQITRIWSSWYPQIARPRVEAEPDDRSRSAAADTAAAFFSGGVDSFFTLLRVRDDVTAIERPPVRSVVTVHGFDVPLHNSGAFARMRSRFDDVVGECGVTAIDVATNLRITRWARAPWGRLAHGCALAAIAHVLRTYSTVYIAATGGYRDLHPWGSHPLTDPLLSTERTRIVHDGAAFTRVEKTRLLTTSNAAMRTLRVCWKSESDENCGRCNKCLRTMLILELLGALDRCETFDASRVGIVAASRILCAEPWDFRELRDIRALATERGRPDLANAATISMRGSRRLTRALGAVRSLHRHTAIRSLTSRLEKRMLAGWAQ
jgi:hypothetical protein